MRKLIGYLAKSGLTVFLLLSFSFVSAYAQGHIPHLIRYKGNIQELLKESEVKKEEAKEEKDKDGKTYSLTFRIYNLETGGEPLWIETHPEVIVEKQEFEVLLGSITPLDLKFNQDYWLSIEIDGQGEILPRQRMTSVGYAYMADDSYKLGGRYADDFAIFGHSHIGEDVVSPVAEAINADTVDGLHANQLGGIKDHGLLEGLSDDDHLQYLNILRGDERYAGIGWDGLTKLKTAQDHIVNKNNPHFVTLEQLGHIDNNTEEEAPTATERGEPTGTEIQEWANDITAWGHSNLVINLNADKVDGKDSTEFSLIGHFHTLMDLSDVTSGLRAAFLAAGTAGASGTNRLATMTDVGAVSGLWTDEGTYIYPNNAGNSFQITDSGSLFVNGNVGIGTISPVRKLHIVGFTNRGEHEPLVRVESYDGQALLELQAAEGSNEDAEIDLKSAYPVADQKIWNLHSGLNGGFSIRRFSDVGHNLLAMPFSISPEGRVGIGTINPQFGLDINGATFTDITGSHRARVYDDTPRSQVGYTCGLSDWSHSGDFSYFGPGHDGGSGSELLTGDSVVLSSASNVTNGIRIIAANNGTHSAPIIFATGLWYAAAAERMRITSSGNVGIGTTTPQGKLDVNGAIYQRGALLHADYVFEPNYKLESIEEHSDYMWQKKHLKAVPRAAKTADGQEIMEMGSRQRGVLEELEKAHIYIAQLNERLKQLEAKLSGQTADAR